MNISYIRSGDYFIPDLKLPEETRPIGKWGRMHRDYLKEHHPIQFNSLALSGNLRTYLADLNEQVQQRIETLIAQLKSSEGITEELKAADPIAVPEESGSPVSSFPAPEGYRQSRNRDQVLPLQLDTERAHFSHQALSTVWRNRKPDHKSFRCCHQK